ncbi:MULTISPECIES: hypothetical protein [unclassified Luteococcus]|uniref:hypothetical protein n=1 Tax=unclassified Luteococcus TaxID=2639923 RepID=UPI00313D78F2
MATPASPHTSQPRTASRSGIGFGQLGRGEKIITTLLLTLWLLSILGTLWAVPQRATVAEAEAAITGHRVTSTTRQQEQPDGVLGQLLGTSFQGGTDASSDTGEYLEWTDALHRHHWIPLAEVAPVAAKHADPDISYGEPRPTGLELAYLQFSEHRDPMHNTYVTWEYLPAMALGVMEFGLVIAGAARRGTRWFWFWILLMPGLPLDAGLLAYVWAEILGRGPVRVRRLSGYDGFLFCLLVKIVVEMGLVAGQALI